MERSNQIKTSLLCRHLRHLVPFQFHWFKHGLFTYLLNLTTDFFPQTSKSWFLHRNEKSHNGDWIHPAGNPWDREPRDCPLLPVPLILFVYSLGKCAHPYSYHLFLWAAHPYVLFLGKPLHVWPGFLFNNCSQDAVIPFRAESKYLFSRLLVPGLLLPFPGLYWVLPVHSDGLWPLCHHLLSPEIHGHHEPQGLRHLGHRDLDGWLCSHHHSNFPQLLVVLLCL